MKKLQLQYDQPFTDETPLLNVEDTLQTLCDAVNELQSLAYPVKQSQVQRPTHVNLFDWSDRSNGSPWELSACFSSKAKAEAARDYLLSLEM